MRTAPSFTMASSSAWSVSVSEGGVYRFLTLLEDDFDALVRWREQINAMPPSSQPVSAVGMIESIDPYYTQSASDAEALGRIFRSRKLRIEPPASQR